MKFDIRKNRAYNTRLKNVVRNLFLLASAEEWSLVKLAQESKLSYQTVYNLYHGITRLPRYSTIYQIAVALDMEDYFVGVGKQ